MKETYMIELERMFPDGYTILYSVPQGEMNNKELKRITQSMLRKIYKWVDKNEKEVARDAIQQAFDYGYREGLKNCPPCEDCAFRTGK